MKKLRICALLASACLLLSGCAAHTTVDAFHNWSPEAESTAEDNWSYQLSTTESAFRCATAEGEVLAEGSYTQPVMEVFHADGTPYDKITEGNSPAMVVATRFNAFFEARREAWQQDYDEICRLARESKKNGDDCWAQEGYLYSDHVEATFRTNSRMACVTMTTDTFTGGAHGTRLRAAYNFDLRSGEEFTINDMAADYAGLRDAVALEILSQIEGGKYVKYYESMNLFKGYEEIIPEWMSRTLFFGEKDMQVVFGVYDIAPHEAGDVAFTISYDLIRPYLNEYGLEMLELD